MIVMIMVMTATTMTKTQFCLAPCVSKESIMISDSNCIRPIHQQLGLICIYLELQETETEYVLINDRWVLQLLMIKQ